MKWEEPGSTALVVPVPEAEPVVGDYRRQYTPSGADGMAAHITLVAPFIPAPLLTPTRTRRVRAALEPFDAFEFALTGADRFANQTLYLVPMPDDVFIEMSTALETSFPEHAHPSTGRSRIVPHLTVARSDDVGLLDAIERQLEDQLPLDAVAREVRLLERGTDRRWGTRAVIKLETRRSRDRHREPERTE